MYRVIAFISYVGMNVARLVKDSTDTYGEKLTVKSCVKS